MKNRAVSDKSSLKNLQEKKESLTRVQSFPYREELLSVMDTDIYTCMPEVPVKNASKVMTLKNISSVIVVDQFQNPIGILTEKDIMKRFVSADEIPDPATTTVSQVMNTDITTLSPHDTIYNAMSLFSSKGVKHLILTKNEAVCGIVTLRHILKLRYPEPMTLVENISHAESIKDLKEIRNKIPAIVINKLKQNIRAYDLVQMISMLNQDLHKRILDLAVNKLGKPPSPFCIYLTGSHGRLENLLETDQDHGMIIADTKDPMSQYSSYYIELSDFFSDWLDKIGFTYCPGAIMCRNPLWRKSLSEWKQQISYWIKHQVPELGRFATVLFDARPIYGEQWLFDEMNDYAFEMINKNHEVSRFLLDEESQHRVPISFMGGFITEKNVAHHGELEIKRTGLMFLVEGIRILALRHGVRVVSTLKRIKELVRGKIIHKDDGEYFEAAYLFFLHLALESQVEKIKSGKKINTYINPQKMSQRDRETLRHAFKAVSSLQELIAADFGQLIL